MSLICVAGDAYVLKDEYVKKTCDEEGLQRIAIDSSQVEKAINLVKQASFLLVNSLIDIVDFDNWKKADRETFLEEAGQNIHLKIIVRTLQPIKGVETVVFELPKQWQDEEWIKYTKERLAKYNLRADEKAVRKFLKLTGHNDLLIEREIEKLRNVAESVDEQLVEKIVFDYSKAQIDEFCFATSGLNPQLAFESIEGCLREYEPILVCSALVKHFIDLYKVIVLVPRKTKYSWPDVKNFSNNLSMPIPKIARFLGFEFKGQSGKVINHMEIYTFEKVEEILLRLQTLDMEIKSSTRSLLSFEIFLDWFFSFMGVQP